MLYRKKIHNFATVRRIAMLLDVFMQVWTISNKSVKVLIKIPTGCSEDGKKNFRVHSFAAPSTSALFNIHFDTPKYIYKRIAWYSRNIAQRGCGI